MIKSILYFLLTLSYTSAGFSEDIIFSVGDFAPYHYEENGEIKGKFIELIERISQQMKVTPKFVIYPWKRALETVKRGDSDGIISVYRTQERDEFLYIAAEPLGFTNISVFTGKENDLKVHELSDLKNTYLLQVRGSSYGPEFDSRTGIFKKIWFCDDIEKQIRLLSKRPSNVAIANETTFRSVSKKLGLQNRFKSVYVFDKMPLYIGFTKKLGEKGKFYADHFSAILKQLNSENKFKDITE